jgi:hypothetical protein
MFKSYLRRVSRIAMNVERITMPKRGGGELGFPKNQQQLAIREYY